MIFGYGIGEPEPLPDGTKVYSSSQALGFCCEVLAVAFLSWDFILIGYIPIKANVVAFMFASSSEPTWDFESDVLDDLVPILQTPDSML